MPSSTRSTRAAHDRVQGVCYGINALMTSGRGYPSDHALPAILDYVEPDHVHVMLDGQIATSGGAELAEKLEDEGYDWVREEAYEAA